MAKINYKAAIIEACKEPLRLLVLSIVPILIAMLTDVPYEWAGIMIVLLRLLDSLMHELGKEVKDDVLITGLTRF